MTRQRALVLILLVLLWSGTAAAQARTDQIASLMAYIPATALTPTPSLEIYFHDLVAAQRATARSPEALAQDPLSGRPLARAYRRLYGLGGDIGEAVPAGLQGEWESRVGFGPDRIAAMLHLYQLPSQLVLLRLADFQDLIAAKQALMVGGYEAMQLGTWSALSRGEDMAIDLDARDPANPFGGQLGRSARIASDGSVLLYAPAWGPVEAVAESTGETLADVPNVQVLLEVLDDQRWADASLIQAMLWPVPWPAFDPTANVIAGNAVTELPDIGLPPWQLGALADLSTGETDYTVVGLVYPDRATAEALALPLLNAWQEQRSGMTDETFAELTGGTAQTYVVGDRPAALVLAIERPVDDMDAAVRNLAHNALMTGYMMRDLSFLGVR
ncbi:MAG: hypothetical protein AAF414_01975 [Pseudomonadota bacterium]